MNRYVVFTVDANDAQGLLENAQITPVGCEASEIVGISQQIAAQAGQRVLGAFTVEQLQEIVNYSIGELEA